ncbi:MAG: hypothetical protein LBN43_09920 [Oscillospiraceae bacterium]|nr:hypothetical protein [Oscillospiraceae bacterium]
MNLSVSVIDWKTANVETRSDFGFSEPVVSGLLGKLRESAVNCVLLSTCNRCELYVTSDDGEFPEPYRLLCGAAGLNPDKYAANFVSYSDGEAVKHLFDVACGLQSQIMGEEQILTQLKSAALAARDAKSSDGVLQTLFRLAITAGKESRTKVRLVGTPPSVADSAVQKADAHFGGLSGKSAVVIGNGEVGKLCASLLYSRGCNVTVTLRSYKHGETIIPKGCGVIVYEERFSAIDGCDLVFSATTSPHLTIACEQFISLEKKPAFIADLAVPYDTDRRLKGVSGLTLIDMDDFDSEGEARLTYNSSALSEIAEIEDKRIAEFYRWLNNRERLNPRQYPKFPLFVDISGKKCVVIGGGTVGTRRAKALLSYGANVTVIDPEMRGCIDGAEIEKREFRDFDLAGAFIAVAATSDRAVNRRIAELCKASGIYVSAADASDECSFWFPASCVNERLNVGLVSRFGEHGLVAEAARKIRSLMGEL